MRFDELVLKTSEGDLRLRFHARLTVLCGLGRLERQSLADSILGAMTGGEEQSSLRYVDGSGRSATLVNDGGRLAAHHDDDGTPAPKAIGPAVPNPDALRSMMLVRAGDVSEPSPQAREDEPAELREARATLEELTAELEAALARQQEMADLAAHLEAVDEELAAARDGLARREYAQVLAQLDRVRAESAAVQSGAAGIEADRHLLASADAARDLMARWTAAAEALDAAVQRFGDRDRIEQALVEAVMGIPEELPRGLAVHIEAVDRAIAERDRLDHRLQELAVATLPAPSDPVVADLGVLDQDTLWTVAARVVEALEAVERMQVAHGGIGGDDAGGAPAVIEEIESAHQAVEAAERAADAVRVPGIAGTAIGAAVAAVGAIGAPILIPVGLLGGTVAAASMLLRPRVRVRLAARAEQATLEAAEAPSYLGFHLRRVDAAVDPRVREEVDAAAAEQREAQADWTELVGPDVTVGHALALADEVRSYNTALRNLGGAADEIEQIRSELADRAEPALATARAALTALCQPFQLAPDALGDTAQIVTLLDQQVLLGRTARLQAELEKREADEQKAAAHLDDVLLKLGFADADLVERWQALELAVEHAAEREAARAVARPRAEIDAELRELEASAQRLRRPEWGKVTAAEAATPDVEELEERRAELAARLAKGRGEVDIERLADRHAAIERRVAALDARHGGHDVLGDPGALAEIHERLTARLARAASAGAHGDPLPLVLDEVFMRVPAERMYDMLDRLQELAEDHQLVYLSDDAFVAAWARQQAAAGTITLLEPAPA